MNQWVRDAKHRKEWMNELPELGEGATKHRNEWMNKLPELGEDATKHRSGINEWINCLS